MLQLQVSLAISETYVVSINRCQRQCRVIIIRPTKHSVSIEITDSYGVYGKLDVGPYVCCLPLYTMRRILMPKYIVIVQNPYSRLLFFRRTVYITREFNNDIWALVVALFS